MLTLEDIEQSITIDYPLSFVAGVLRENLISSGLLKNYKWKKKIRSQEEHVFNSLKNALIDNEASIVFVRTPSPRLLIMSKETLEGLEKNHLFDTTARSEE